MEHDEWETNRSLEGELNVMVKGSEDLTIKVFTLKKCPKCPHAKKIAQRIAEKFGAKYVEIDLETPSGQIEGLMHQIMSTPSIALGDDVIARGRVMSELELENEVRMRLEALNS